MTGELPLLTDEIDGIFRAMLNRPAKLNALDKQTMGLLDEAILHFRDTPTLRVMLIRATGRYFCSGADLLEEGSINYPKGGRNIRKRMRIGLNGMERMWTEIEALEKPVVVAHHAPCFGAGIEMSLSCDFRLAAESASYALPEVAFGLLPALGGISRLSRLVGPHWARYMVMANRKISAERALAIGLVHEVHPDDQFEDAVMAFCRDLAQQPPEATGMAKLAIDMTRDFDPGEARRIEQIANSTLLMGDEYKTEIAKTRARLARNKKS